MISLLHLNKLSQFIIFFTILTFGSVLADRPADIWKEKENQNQQSNKIIDDKEITLESPILSDDIKITQPIRSVGVHIIEVSPYDSLKEQIKVFVKKA